MALPITVRENDSDLVCHTDSRSAINSKSYSMFS